MAEKKTRLSASDIGSVRPDSNATGTDVLKAINHLRENILLYLAGIAFLIFCIVAGILFRVSAMNAEKSIMTEYAAAMGQEDPAVRAAELESVARAGGRWGIEALYAMGEALIQAGEYDRARDAFQSVLDKDSRSEYAPKAAEGLGWLAENRGDFDAALDAYAKVATDYPASFLARIQDLNRARVLEKQERWEEAKAAYEAQITAFPESNAAMRAEEGLDRLRTNHPDLFPEPEPELTEETDAAEAVETEEAGEAIEDAEAAEAPEAVEDTEEPEAADAVEQVLEDLAEDMTEEAVEAPESDAADTSLVDEAAQALDESVDAATEIVDDGATDADDSAEADEAVEHSGAAEDEVEE